MKQRTTYHPKEITNYKLQIADCRCEGPLKVILTHSEQQSIINNQQSTNDLPIIQQINKFPHHYIFLLLTLFYACSPQETTFQPRHPSESPPKNLDQYLNTKNTINRINQLTNTKEQLDSLLYYTDLLKNYDEDVALEYAQEANLIASVNNLDFSEGISQYYIAMLKGRKEKFGEAGIEIALAHAKISLDIFKNLEIQEWQIKTNNLIGIFHYRKSELDSALFYQNEALKLIEAGLISMQDSLLLKGEIFHDLANIYTDKDSTKVIQYFQKGFEHYQLTNNLPAMSRLRLDLGEFFNYQKQFSKADSMFQQSVKYALEFKDKNNLVDILQRRGGLRLEQYRVTKKEQYFFEALKDFNDCLNLQDENQHYTYALIGNTFQSRANRQAEYLESHLDSAVVYYKLALDEAEKEGRISDIKNMAGNISKICDYFSNNSQYFKGKNCKEILGNSTATFLNSSYTDIVDTVTQKLQIANEQIKDYELKEQEEKNNQKIKNQWFISGSSLLFAILTFSLILLWQQQKRLKAKMAALRAQINPHFISNSLNAIESLVNLDKKEAASKYLIRFSRLSRRILNSSVDAITTLEYELQTLDHFLALEKLRFRDKLNYEIQVSSGLNSKMIQVPAMILQPFVENAIWHGIKPKQGPGSLQINIERNGKLLVCTITDDGIGREKAAQLKSASLLSQQKSHGMKITKDRLQLLGKAKGAKVEIIDLLDTTGEAMGTRVIIRIPFKLKKNKPYESTKSNISRR